MPEPVSRCTDDGGRVHVLAQGDPTSGNWRSRLQPEMEHGMDARHPALPAAGPGVSPVSPRQAHLWIALRFFGKFRAAAIPRRSRTRQIQPDSENAGG